MHRRVANVDFVVEAAVKVVAAVAIAGARVKVGVIDVVNCKVVNRSVEVDELVRAGLYTKSLVYIYIKKKSRYCI